MRQRLRIAALMFMTAALLGAPSSSWALGSVAWTAVGPFGSTPRELQVGAQPGLLWGSNAHAVYHSVDFGSSWQRVLTLPVTSYVASVVPDASSAGSAWVLEASAGGYRLRRTADAGATWPVGSPLPGRGPGNPADYYNDLTLAADPVVSARLWLLISAPMSGFQSMYRSDDGGTTWSVVPGPVPNPDGFSVGPDEIWSWDTFGAAVRRSSDGGATYGQPEYPTLPHGAINWIRADPGHDGVIYASLSRFASNGVEALWDGPRLAPAYLFRSSDDGATWALEVTGAPAGFEVGALAFGGGRTIAALQRPYSYADLYSGGAGMIERSAGGWAPLDDGFPDATAVTGLSGDSSGRFYASPWSGRTTLRLDPSATTWQAEGAIDTQGAAVGALTFAPWSGELLASTPFGLLTRTGALSWAPFGSGLPPDAPIRRTIPTGPSSAVTLVHDVGVYRSIDQGATWAPTPTQPPAASTLVDIAAAPGLILVTDGRGVWRSSDQGASWTKTLKLEATNPRAYGEAGVAIGGRSHGIVIANGDSGSWISHDRGVTWHRASGDSFWGSLETSTGPDGRTYVAGGDPASTVDGGRTWQTPVNSRGNPYDALAVAADPTRAGVAWAADFTTLWRTSDGGDDWRRISTLPHRFSVSDMVIDPDGALRIASLSDGVFDVAPRAFESGRPHSAITQLRRPVVGGRRLSVKGRAADQAGGSGLRTVEFNLVVRKLGGCLTWESRMSWPIWADYPVIHWLFVREPCAMAVHMWHPVTLVRRAAGTWTLTLPKSTRGIWTLRVRAIDRETNAQLRPLVRTFRVG